MAKEILVLGGPGTGKSASLEGLDPKETFIINCIGKPLPFKGSMSKYTIVNKETNPDGNVYESVDSDKICTVLDILDKKPWVKNVIVDDFQYIMSYEFIDKADQSGWDKFTKIAQHAFNIIDAGKKMRPDINFVVLCHSEESIDTLGRRFTKIKTIGKLLDEKIAIEGMFTIVLNTIVERTPDGFKYQFLTNTDGFNTAKSPKDMFDIKVPNDLNLVIQKMNEYYK